MPGVQAGLWPFPSPLSPCAGLHAEETGCSDSQGGQPGPELVAELQEEAEAEPLPWAGGERGLELGTVCWEEKVVTLGAREAAVQPRAFK